MRFRVKKFSDNVKRVVYLKHKTTHQIIRFGEPDEDDARELDELRAKLTNSEKEEVHNLYYGIIM